VALGNLKRPEAMPALIRTLQSDPDPLVRGHAAWALGQIRAPEAEAALRATGSRETDPTVLSEIESASTALTHG
jgi:epoxyqueuosine reductase